MVGVVVFMVYLELQSTSWIVLDAMYVLNGRPGCVYDGYRTTFYLFPGVGLLDLRNLSKSDSSPLYGFEMYCI